MQITWETDYAIRIVCCLAREGKRMDAKAIAEETGVTLRFSLKILRKLVTASIVRSFKGAQGGYELCKPPEQIHMRGVIEAIEGDILINRCLKESTPCSGDFATCRAHQQFRRISRLINDEFERVSFDQLL